ncbi:hypothetical protein E1L19_01205 [Salmonella enterica subsp. enterica]|nr:hypothetical protein [Salmonella bongori]ECI7824623.1 hypothetical protein [Salmonella enterica subsp. enterica]ECN8820287.1 hypothetical protein [Salmonella enterica subsp. enterica serovar Newport]EDA0852632.1 hypothetical protein [Salmonella enterica]EIV7027907.1 hypothetical protein [Salmonella enterica]
MSTSQKHKQMMDEVIDFLCFRFPKAFSRERSGIRPLKNDIFEDIIHELGHDSFRYPVRRALIYYQARPHYLLKVILGKWRRDLYGNRVALITQCEKDFAQKKLDNIITSKRLKNTRSQLPPG